MKTSEYLVGLFLKSPRLKDIANMDLKFSRILLTLPLPLLNVLWLVRLQFFNLQFNIFGHFEWRYHSNDHANIIQLQFLHKKIIILV